MRKLEWLVFDLDGLLIDTERLYQVYWDRTFLENGIVIDKEQRLEIVGMGIERVKDLFKAKYGDGETFDRLREIRDRYFWQHVEEFGLPLKEGAVNILQYALNHQIKTALATSSTQSKAYQLLSYTSLNHPFDYMIYGDQVERMKPDPDIFNRVIEDMQWNRNHGYILEDSYNGVWAANRAKIPVIWVKDMVDLSVKPELTIDVSCNSLHEALELIKPTSRSLG